ncbi:MAG TPA: iduronate sulfatase [Opitutae bacterium]|nr:iduronate sulfatase [Opitutae bacterium]
MLRFLVLILFASFVFDWGGSLSASKPNILFIVSDDLTACLGSYGNEICQTPNLDRLASEGVQFDRAYCQYPVCGASRASFMSGLYPKRNGMMGNSYTLGSYRAMNPKLADHPSIGGFLRRNGYVSLRVSKIYHMGVPGGIEAGEPGGDDPDSWDRAIDVMAPETASPGVLELLSPKRTHYGSNFARIIVPDDKIETQADALTATQAIAILDSRARGGEFSKFIRPEEPFFLAVGFVRPHVPLVAPKSMFDLYDEDSIPLPYVPEGDLDDLPEPAAAMANEGRYWLTEKQQRQSIAAYYASVTYMDQQVGRLLDALDRLGQRENTIVIFTSDHGYNLGEHTMWQKLSLFEESARVPLLISAPGFEKAAGKKAQGLVELVDLYPTLLDLTGLKDKAPANLDGISLRPLLDNPDSKGKKKLAYTVTRSSGESIRTDRYRYNRWGNEGEELYDHQADPKEFTNLVGMEQHSDTLKRLRALLETKNEKF